MQKSNLRPAYYALQPGAWKDYLTLLHFPYTVWHLSYVLLGAAAAPTLFLDRTGGVIFAFFLAVGLGAHALDEYKGRPLKTNIPDGLLLGIAVTSLAGALAIGVIASISISPWAVPFVLFGGFIVPAYNLEWFRGRFHSDASFAFSWGAFPALVGYWANAQDLDVPAFLIAAACLGLSLAQRSLSKQARSLRRNARTASGEIEFQDGHVEAISIASLLIVPEIVLKLMGLSIGALALGWLASRL